MTATALSIVRSASEILRPPRRMSVSEAAHLYLRLNRPGGESGPWNPSRTPYMVAPMDRLADRRVEVVVFVGPARCGKTFALLVGWLAYILCCDPGDFLIVHMAENTARKFSKDELTRAHRHSPELKARLSPYASDDNVFDKQYRNGMLLKLGWPSVNQLSGDTLRYVAITDYDRIAEDIDGEGSAFSLARKRVQTYQSSGRVVVESSPGWEIENPRWIATDPHEAPPCKGIFSLYNTGDRNRWFWPCPHCSDYFTAAPSPEVLTLIPDGGVHLICPHCGSAIAPSHKPAMNRAGHWVAAGQTIDGFGRIHGEAPKTNIASYWLTGPAAAYQSWKSLWSKSQAAEQEYEKTGSESALKTIITGDFGAAYRPRTLSVVRESTTLMGRAEDTPKRHIPAGVRYLVATVDVQGNRFVVQVTGNGPDNERWLIDRYNLRYSPTRTDGNGEPEPINPPKYPEDWRILIDQVARKPYPFADDPSRGLLPVITGVDSGGKAGSTERAYAFWKYCRSQGLGKTIRLLRGNPKKDAPRVMETWPDSSQRADRKANARGEIPVYQINTFLLKDTLAADLDRPEPGPGYLHFPNWLGPWFYDELTNETRAADKWVKTGPNEALDLMVYNSALVILLGGERIKWDNPPAWADPERSAIAIGGDHSIPVSPPIQKTVSPPAYERRDWSL